MFDDRFPIASVDAMERPAKERMIKLTAQMSANLHRDLRIKKEKLEDRVKRLSQQIKMKDEEIKSKDQIIANLEQQLVRNTKQVCREMVDSFRKIKELN